MPPFRDTLYEFLFGTEKAQSVVCSCLLSVKMGPTNQETLDWLKNLSVRKYSESNVEAAKVFFGKYNGTRKMFSMWTEKFLTEHKKVKQEAHTRLMKACGGSGKKFDIPPSDFVPLSLSIENKCVKCNDVFENTNSVKSHITHCSAMTGPLTGVGASKKCLINGKAS